MMARLKLTANFLVLGFAVFCAVVLFERLGRYQLQSVFLVVAATFAIAFISVRSIKNSQSNGGRTRQVRPLLLGILGPVLVISLAFWWFLRPGPLMGEGPAGPEVDKGKFSAPWIESPVVLLSIGDSVVPSIISRSLNNSPINLKRYLVLSL